jgi:NAD(P)-dependent dehydrogenase (short-subunit alcohol dehydrogenase family)
MKLHNLGAQRKLMSTDQQKTIIVTGATGNLGRVVVGRLLSDGHRVITTFLERKDDPLSAGEKFESHKVDLADEQAASRFVDSVIQKHRNIDAALLLAGGYAGGTIRNTGSHLIRKMIALNFETAYHIARPVFNQMVRQPSGGRIVLVSARAGMQTRDAANNVAYGLSKSLILRLAEILNAEGASHNVVTSVIVPSTIDTPANRTAMPDADFTKWVSPEDIAAMIDFLLSKPAQSLRETVLKM